MAVIPVLVSPDIRARIAEVRAHAEAHHTPTDTTTSPGARPEHVAFLGPFVRCVYCVWNDDRGRWRHLSATCYGPDGRPLTPNRLTMASIADAWGFGPSASLGTMAPDPPHVVHAVEPWP